MRILNFMLSIINFILWIGLFISLFFINYSYYNLKICAIGAMFIVIMDIILDLLVRIVIK
ncbi:conserved hypothetical protein [Clostridium neonatale]|nr:conserved hypothetical protein [Clostridium neonatale]